MISKINVLEYRLNDEFNDFPALYHYKNLEREQIYVRRECELFVKDGIIYQQTSSALEDDRFVIYVEETKKESPIRSGPTYDNLVIEVREFKNIGERKILHTYHCFNHDEVLGYLGNTYITLSQKEYCRVLAEVDEDRKAYILFVEDTGLIIED
ncbi:hypothetical protein [Bacillus taeanensis]|uniref:Uncharacterized protein n=1 Tax=Bacillus taeanensis TaxID=273032 RepID=A0A366XUK4_9BACI|nr:hypothetical protein [Bacillus taeanensis]RBW67823.1 hypothetical protein DS031_19955 [Bacillus taeanensis]